jgi:hypothetical protein
MADYFPAFAAHFWLHRRSFPLFLLAILCLALLVLPNLARSQMIQAPIYPLCGQTVDFASARAMQFFYHQAGDLINYVNVSLARVGEPFSSAAFVQTIGGGFISAGANVVLGSYLPYWVMARETGNGASILVYEYLYRTNISIAELESRPALVYLTTPTDTVASCVFGGGYTPESRAIVAYGQFPQSMTHVGVAVGVDADFINPSNYSCYTTPSGDALICNFTTNLGNMSFFASLKYSPIGLRVTDSRAEFSVHKNFTSDTLVAVGTYGFEVNYNTNDRRAGYFQQPVLLSFARAPPVAVLAIQVWIAVGDTLLDFSPYCRPTQVSPQGLNCTGAYEPAFDFQDSGVVYMSVCFLNSPCAFRRAFRACTRSDLSRSVLSLKALTSN